MDQSKTILEKAISFLGTKENPSGSNKVLFNTAFYGRVVSGSSYRWCMVFIWYVFYICDMTALFFGGRKTASCENFLQWAIKNGYVTTNPVPGDLVLYQFDKDVAADHVGFFEYWNTDGTFNAIEGNTAVGNDANGGCVMRRTRKKSLVKAFVHIPYTDIEIEKPVNPYAEPTKTIYYSAKKENVVQKVVKWMQFELKRLGYYTGAIDGKYGPKTKAALILFQTDHPETYMPKKEPDCACGKITRGCLKAS